MRPLRCLPALFALLAACSEPRPTLDQVAPPEIAIKTVPKGAAATVDGIDSGITPMAFHAASRDAVHKLGFTHEGYLASEITVIGEDVFAHSGQQVLVFLRPNVWDTKSKPIAPENTGQLTRAGQDLSKAGRCPEALPYLAQAIEIDPHLAPAHKALGICYGKLKQNAKALEEYKAYILYAPPEAPDLEKVRAIVNQAQGDIDVGPPEKGN